MLHSLIETSKLNPIKSGLLGWYYCLCVMSGQFSGLYFAIQSAKFKSLFQPRDMINIILTLFSHFFSDHVFFLEYFTFPEPPSSAKLKFEL